MIAPSVLYGENDVSKIENTCTCSADADDGCMMLLGMYKYVIYIPYIFCGCSFSEVTSVAYYALLVEHNLFCSKLCWHNLEKAIQGYHYITFAPRGFGTPGDMYGTLRVPYHHVSEKTYNGRSEPFHGRVRVGAIPT